MARQDRSRERFDQALDALLRPNVRAGTIQDALALGEVWQEHEAKPVWCVEALAKTHDRWGRASDRARMALVTQLMERPEAFQAKVAPRLLDCLFPGTLTAQALRKLMWGNKATERQWNAADLWPHVRKWLEGKGQGQGPLMQGLCEALAGTAILATRNRDCRLLDGLLDLALALPQPGAVYQALWDSWVFQAMSHAVYSGSRRALERMVGAGMDINAPSKGQHAFAHLCVQLRENYPNLVQRGNRKDAIQALLDHGADWRCVDLDRVEDEVRAVFEVHPWVARTRLYGMAQAQRPDLLNPGLRSARRI